MKIEVFDASKNEYLEDSNSFVKFCEEDLIIINPKSGEKVICPVTGRMITLGPANTCDQRNCENFDLV